MNFAQYIAATCKSAGSDRVFGIPSYVGLETLKAFDEAKFQLVLNSHEQNAVHAAEGYYLGSGKLPIVAVAIGPGLTNALTGIADAYCESIPLIIIAGRVYSHMFGR